MNFNKYLLIAGLATTLTSNTILGQNNNTDIRVSLGVGARYIISQKDAEKALAKLSKTAFNEDAWMYHKGQLIDIGYNENPNHIYIRFPPIIITENKDTIKLKVEKGDTVTFYHNHTSNNMYSKLPRPPSIEDMISYSMIKDSVYPNNVIKMNVVDTKNMWGFSLEDELMNEFNNKSGFERYKLLESKINIIYDPTNAYLINGKCMYPYDHIKASDKKAKEYLSIMKEAKVKIKLRKPGKGF
jgi:hypothetical protein